MSDSLGVPRTARLAQLGARAFDLLIVGGGIVGAGIARDAVMRGLRVALIEQGDFASGASSKTSKLIHGGLRYLEHGHLRLVRESLRERQILRTIAPSLVVPLELALPVYRGDARPAWKVNLGLWLYTLLAAGRRMSPSHMLSARRALACEPGLRFDGLRAAGLYADCQMDDARICLANVLQAISFGAVCCNYVRLRTFLMANGRVCGGQAEDLVTGRSIEIHAKAVVNAAGPWADQIRRMSRPDATARLAPTKGIHVVVPRVSRSALFVQASADGRMIFILPWGDDYSLVGTTESRLDGALDELSANSREVEYLLREVKRVLPGSRVGEGDVVATYAGARPLLAFSGPSTRASREHRLEVDDSGLVSILGGKFTTYRVMAQQVVEWLARDRGWRVEPCLTDQVNLLEPAQAMALEHWREVTRTLDPELLARLLTRYGTGAFRVLELLAQDPRLAEPVCPHHPYIHAELVHAMHQELACTITDVLARRTRVAWSSCQGLDFLSTMIDLCQRYGGMSPQTAEQQANQYRQVLASGAAFRTSRSPQRTVSATV